MTNHRIALWLALCLATGAAAAAQDIESAEPPGVVISPGSAAAREPRIDHEAERANAVQVLDTLEEKYKALQTYHLAYHKVSTVQHTSQEETTAIWMERDEELGPRWRMEMDIVRQIQDTAPTSIRTINVSLHDESWTESRTGEQKRVIRSLPNQWNSHFDVLRRSIAAYINHVTVEGEDTFKDHTCTVFRITRGPERRRTIQRFWICNETGLLVRETQQREGRTDTTNYEIQKVETNQPIPESVWEYTPPEDVEVMDLTEQQQQRQQTREWPRLPMP